MGPRRGRSPGSVRAEAALYPQAALCLGYPRHGNTVS